MEIAFHFIVPVIVLIIVWRYLFIDRWARYIAKLKTDLPPAKWLTWKEINECGYIGWRCQYALEILYDNKELQIRCKDMPHVLVTKQKMDSSVRDDLYKNPNAYEFMLISGGGHRKRRRAWRVFPKLASSVPQPA